MAKQHSQLKNFKFRLHHALSQLINLRSISGYYDGYVAALEDVDSYLRNNRAHNLPLLWKNEDGQENVDAVRRGSGGSTEARDDVPAE